MSASKLTPEVRGGLVERTAAGVSLADACRSLSLRHKTVKGWITRGRREDAGPYRDLVYGLEAAREAARSRPAPLTEDELRREVSRMVSAGSASAAKLYWEMLRADRGEDDDAGADDPLAEVDEIARARARRAAG